MRKATATMRNQSDFSGLFFKQYLKISSISMSKDSSSASGHSNSNSNQIVSGLLGGGDSKEDGASSSGVVTQAGAEILNKETTKQTQPVNITTKDNNITTKDSNNSNNASSNTAK